MLMFILREILAVSSHHWKKSRVPSTVLLVMSWNQPRMYKIGIRRTNQRIKENHSMIGLQRIRKLLRSFFYWLVQFKEQRTMWRNSSIVLKSMTGYGNKKLRKAWRSLMLTIHNWKTSKRSLRNSFISKMKLIRLNRIIKLVHWIWKLRM